MAAALKQVRRGLLGIVTSWEPITYTTNSGKVWEWTGTAWIAKMSYEYYGLSYCPWCGEYVLAFDREPHEMWHRLKEAP